MMIRPEERSAGLTDDLRTIPVAERLALTVVVNDDGTETWWVLRIDAAPNADHGCGCASCAPHDQVRP